MNVARLIRMGYFMICRRRGAETLEKLFKFNLTKLSITFDTYLLNYASVTLLRILMQFYY